MKIKKVVAKDMQVALHLLRKELGPEAVIVSSRTIREPGFWGLFKPPRVEVTAAVERMPEKEPHEDSLRAELHEIRALIHQIGVTEHKTSAKGGLTPKWAERFRAADLSPEIVSLLSEQLGNGAGGRAEEESRVLERLAKYFTLPAPRGKGKRISVFVGPTGVGKTTTIAKLAARRALQEKKRVSLITIDTFRIGAVEQLKIYGDIIGVPVEVVTSPSEFREVLKLQKNKDDIFVDTTGRSAKKPLQVGELKAYFDDIPDLDKYLVVSATTKSRDLLSIYRAFCDLNLYAAIVTKCDETENLGGIVDLCYRTALPVAYATNGQNVPEDIRVVDPMEMARMVLGVQG
ncbi:MAG: flagellar biosynthesis protein FlhF [Firmicutes bacterium]|nr:flagellar biosynthesis protein FlhF [Dethiobacter sp.]MBS3888654.1 flagellar biosynthesis protein FlhF [Bacillota bacterium]